jgi:hypothetical protein
MELVPGRTLAETIHASSTGLSIDEALSFAPVGDQCSAMP